MKTAVCSIDRRLTEWIKRILLNMPEFKNVQEFYAIDGLLDTILQGAVYDYIFLEVDGKAVISGLDFAEDLYKENPETNIIYITSDGNQLIEKVFLIDANIAGVLKKPLEGGRFRDTIKTILSRKRQRREQKLVFRKNGEISTIPLSEIIYIESRGHTVFVYTKAKSYIYYGKLGSITEQLPENFLQCHKSYLVNMDKIRKIGRDYILMVNKHEIPISQARVKMSKTRYIQYAKKVSEYIVDLNKEKG